MKESCISQNSFHLFCHFKITLCEKHVLDIGVNGTDTRSNCDESKPIHDQEKYVSKLNFFSVSRTLISFHRKASVNLGSY